MFAVARKVLYIKNFLIIRGVDFVKKLISLIALFFVLALILSACSELKDNIVGQWECEVPGEKIFTYDFKADGTGTYTENSTSYAFTYKVRANRVRISITTDKGDTETYVLRYEDEKLTYNDDENELIFIKRDSKS